MPGKIRIHKKFILKKYSFQIRSLFLLIPFFATVSAQQNHTPRCATMEGMERYFQLHPEAKNLAESNRNRFATLSLTQTQIQRTHAIINIPVVFHIVGTATRQSQVTDADVLWQLNKMNEDFGGANSDSTNAVDFYGIRAKKNYCQIRFCLAQRTPVNLSSNGINRVVSTLNSTQNCDDVNLNGNATWIKHSITGGADAWDPSKYFNIWVGEFDPCLLGIATLPGLGPDNEQGIAIDFTAFSNNPAYVDPVYNLGRTAVHETGHYFGLYHIWGDDGGCSNSDFRQLPGTCILPGSLSGGLTDQSVGDTPNQASQTTNCPSGILTDACATVFPGKNYQNYMDYTHDACYSMFSVKQVDRMQWILDNCRALLITSNGCVAVPMVPDNAGISAIVTPPAGFISCDPVIPLIVTLKNFGTNILNTVNINVILNGSSVESRNLSGLNMLPGASQNISLNNLSLINGSNSLQVCTSLPNGNSDTDPLNDCVSINVSRGNGQPLPLVEGFESGIFPPPGWILNNPDNNITWQRNISGVSHGGTANAFLNHFNYTGSAQTDDLRTPAYVISTADSLWVSFWAAYRGKPATLFETFQLMVSSDCGQTFQTIYNARNDTAFVSPPGSSPFSSTSYFPSAPDHWVKKSFNLSSLISSGNVLVQLRTTNQGGNNLLIDDINIDKKIFPNNDAGVILINKPTARICADTARPEVIIKNFGKTLLTSVRINYQLDGTGTINSINWTGSLSRNQTATVTFPLTNLGSAGIHFIRAYTSLPNNISDEDALNDTLVKNITVYQVFSLSTNVNVKEEFTSTIFPPTNWNIFNPDNDLTWERHTSAGNKNPGSAWFNDFSNSTVNRFDDLLLPNYKYSGIDSIFLTFNVAHALRNFPVTPGARQDTLQVLVSKDCGNNFTSVYKKYGAELQTIPNPPVTGNFVPATDQWRKDSVNLGQWLGTSESKFVLSFRFSGNMENNLFLDDVNIRTQILPAKLKAEGVVVLPNPFHSVFGVWHYLQPSNLKYILVYNAAGQKVWSKQFSNGGEKYIQVDLSGKATGMYTVVIGYKDSDQTINIPIIKF